MVLGPGVAEGFVLPVDALHLEVVFHRLVAVGDAVCVVSAPEILVVAIAAQVVLQPDILIGGKDRKPLRKGAVAGRTVVVDRQAPLPAGFGRHEHDAVGGTRAVDGCGGGILEHLDGCDVLVGEVVDVADFEAVHDV